MEQDLDLSLLSQVALVCVAMDGAVVVMELPIMFSNSLRFISLSLPKSYSGISGMLLVSCKEPRRFARHCRFGLRGREDMVIQDPRRGGEAMGKRLGCWS